ncbi:MAG: FKBP-type peptidyl-prolyl cis-trans isomerase [Chloroflexota bacterium]
MKLRLTILLMMFTAFVVACGPPPAPEGYSSGTDGQSASASDGTLEVGDIVEIAMVGTLAETGDIFVDTTGAQPIIFRFGEGTIFPGWDPMFEGKKVGDKISADVMAENAFGAAGAPPAIPPNADLHFEIEILNILDVEKQIIEEGDGPQPEEGQTVRVHYTGTLEDGTVFDSSEGRDPLEFPLGAGFVIPGWELGIARMNVGEKAVLTIPSALAYGAQGSPPAIPPNSTLIFEVELVEIVGQ